MNWSLNVYPLLQPGLSELYTKIRGKSQPNKGLWISTRLHDELMWFLHHFEESDGVCLMDTQAWSVDEADAVFLADTCPFGMGFWSPMLLQGFHHAITKPALLKNNLIFFKEAYMVISALLYAVQQIHPIPKQIVIHTDSSNRVDLFNTLHAKQGYNPLLLTAINLMLKYHVQLHVDWISGSENAVADALSCLDND